MVSPALSPDSLTTFISTIRKTLEPTGLERLARLLAVTKENASAEISKLSSQVGFVFFLSLVQHFTFIFRVLVTRQGVMGDNIVGGLLFLTVVPRVSGGRVPMYGPDFGILRGTMIVPSFVTRPLSHSL